MTEEPRGATANLLRAIRYTPLAGVVAWFVLDALWPGHGVLFAVIALAAVLALNTALLLRARRRPGFEEEFRRQAAALREERRYGPVGRTIFGALALAGAAGTLLGLLALREAPDLWILFGPLTAGSAFVAVLFGYVAVTGRERLTGLVP